MKLLISIGGPVNPRLLQGEYRPGFRIARRVTNHRGEVTDNHDDFVVQVLELPHFSQNDCVSYVQSRARREYKSFKGVHLMSSGFKISKILGPTCAEACLLMVPIPRLSYAQDYASIGVRSIAPSERIFIYYIKTI